jgi:hypothetical protein
MGVLDGGISLTASDGSFEYVCRARTAGWIYLDETRADHIRMTLGCGRIVVPCRFSGTLRLCRGIACIASAQRAFGAAASLPEPARNAIAGQHAAAGVIPGHRVHGMRMDCCL